MQRFFDRPLKGDRPDAKGSDLIDWTVLLAGIVMLALSVAPAVSVRAEKISGDALDRVAPEEDWLPS